MNYAIFENPFVWRFHEPEIKCAVALYNFISSEDKSVLDINAGVPYLSKLLPDETGYSNDCSNDSTVDAVVIADVWESLDEFTRLIDKAANVANEKILIAFAQAETKPRTEDCKVTFVRMLEKHGFLISKEAQDLYYVYLCFSKASHNNLRKFSYCTGCGACANVCPASAISLTPDDNGFFRPDINKEICMDCKGCAKACLRRTHNGRPENSSTPECYALQAHDNIIEESSSGGAFSLLASETLKRGGVVCGATWNSEFGVELKIISDASRLHTLQKSKYLQPEVGQIYREIKDYLSSGKEVLFSGLPCHVAALYSSLQKEYTNLYTIDLLCSRTPSQEHFKKYLNDVYGIEKLASFDFRFKDETHNWSQLAVRAKFKDGREIVKRGAEDVYMSDVSVDNLLMMNNACENCAFYQMPRQADITIGDFWGMRYFVPDICDEQGTSIVMLNNEKGASLLDRIKGEVKELQQVPVDAVKKYNRVRRLSANAERDRFFSLIKRMPFDKAYKYAKDKKYDIGIVGWYNISNHGSVMTYYALYRLVTDMGLEALMIPPPRPWDTRMSDVMPVSFKRNPYDEYASLSHMMHMLQSKDSMRALNEHCDRFLVGSDQVFCMKYVNEFDKYFILDWVTESKKKAAYASSFGTTAIGNVEGTERDRLYMSHFLQKFDYVSLREERSVEDANQLFGVRDAEWVLDPVFLLDAEHYNEMAELGAVPEGDYIAVYMLLPRGKHVIDAVSSHFEIENINYFTRASHQRPELDWIGSMWGVSPFKTIHVEDWLRSFRDSKIIIADSFHATCFAIIFKKPFVVIPTGLQTDSRKTSLLGLLGLEERIIYSREQLLNIMPRIMDIDWESVYQRLNAAKEFSMNCLKKAIEPLEKEEPLSAYDLVMERLFSKENLSNYTINHEDLVWLKEKKLVVWGFGVWGKITIKILEDLGVPLYKVVDSQKANIRVALGKVLYFIDHPDQMEQYRHEDINVVIAVRHSRDINTTLDSLGITSYRQVVDVFNSPLYK